MDQIKKIDGPSEEAEAERYGCHKKITIKVDKIEIDKLESGSTSGLFKLNAKDFASDYMTRSRKPKTSTSLDTATSVSRLKRIEDGMVLIHRATYNTNPAKVVMSKNSLSSLNKKAEHISIDSIGPNKSVLIDSAETEETDKNNKCSTKTVLTESETTEGETKIVTRTKSESKGQENIVEVKAVLLKEKKSCKTKNFDSGDLKNDKEISEKTQSTSEKSNMLSSKQVTKFKIGPKKRKINENTSLPQKNAVSPAKTLVKRILPVKQSVTLKRKTVSKDGKKLTPKKVSPNKNLKSVKVKKKHLIATRQPISLRLSHKNTDGAIRQGRRRIKGAPIKNVIKPSNNKKVLIRVNKPQNKVELRKNLLRNRSKEIRKTGNMVSENLSKILADSKKKPNVEKFGKKTKKNNSIDPEKKKENTTKSGMGRKRKSGEAEESKKPLLKKMKTEENAKKKKEDTVKPEEQNIKSKFKSVSTKSYHDVENAVAKLLNGSTDCLQNNLAELYLQIEPSRFPSALWKTETIISDLVNGKTIVTATSKPGPLRRKVSKDPPSLNDSTDDKPKLNSLSEVVVKRCTASKSASHDRIVCVKDNLHFYVKIENHNVSLLGAPQVISNIEDLYVLIQIVDEITIDSFNIEK